MLYVASPCGVAGRRGSKCVCNGVDNGERLYGTCCICAPGLMGLVFPVVCCLMGSVVCEKR